METKSKKSGGAVGFYHENGFVPAWMLASKYAGPGGRVATLPDIIKALVNTSINDTPWNTWYTTASAEYFGLSKGGNQIIIVAHHAMSALSAIQEAYSYHYKDKTRSRTGGRVSQEFFLELESGKHGEVSIIDLKSFEGRYKYPFIQPLRLSQAICEPLVRARLGNHVDDYLLKLATYAMEKHERDGKGRVVDPYVIYMHNANNCLYHPQRIENGLALAHLLSIGRLTCYRCSDREFHGEHQMSEVSCHEWYDGVRLVGVKADSQLETVDEGTGLASEIIAKNWRELTSVFSPTEPDIGFRALMKNDGLWFTQTPIVGKEMASYEMEYLVKSIKKVGKPVKFSTTIEGYYGLFRTSLRGVIGNAPRGANAYALAGEPTIVWKGGNPVYHRCRIQYYRIEADMSRRIMTHDELRNNFDLLLQLVTQ